MASVTYHGPSLPEGAKPIVRNGFIHFPESPDNSDDEQHAKVRFRTCPDMELGQPSDPSSTTGVSDEGRAASEVRSPAGAPRLLGRSSQVEDRKVTVKNGFIHTEEANAWDLSPGPAALRRRPVTWANVETRDGEGEETATARDRGADSDDDFAQGAEDDESPGSLRWARNRAFNTMELQEQMLDGAWSPAQMSPDPAPTVTRFELAAKVQAGAAPAPAPSVTAAPGRDAPTSSSITEAVSKAQEAMAQIEAVSSTPHPSSPAREQGSPKLNLFDHVADSPPLQDPAIIAMAAFGAGAQAALMAQANQMMVLQGSNAAGWGAASMPLCGVPPLPQAMATWGAAGWPRFPCAPPQATPVGSGTSSVGEGSQKLDLASLTTPPAPPPLVSTKALQADGEQAEDATATQAVSRSKGGRRLRLWAHIYLHMQDAPGFDLVPRLIGRGGCHMRKIAEETGAKIRIRGRGSGHLEVDGKSEAPTPLMVAVTTDHQDGQGFKAAIVQTVKALKAVEQRFHQHCEKHSWQHEGPCYSVGLVLPVAREILGSVLDEIPQLDPGTKVVRVQ